MKKVEVISLIFQSVGYLKFIVDQLERYSHAEGYDVSYRIVANDATDKVLNYLKKSSIPYSDFKNPDPEEYYINRVYRAYNYAIKSSSADIVCLLNSDNAFSPGWLHNLLKHYDGQTIPTSRLVESGKFMSGLHGITEDCGRSYTNYDEDKFISYAKQISKEEVHEGGLFMPCLVNKNFQYPEGNVKIGNRMVSGDKYAFAVSGLKHITAFDSIVYHIQEGEKDE